MGQRHMTYVVAVAKDGRKVVDTSVARFFHSWNHANIQLPKLYRFVTHLDKLIENEALFASPEDVVRMYKNCHELSDNSMSIRLIDLDRVGWPAPIFGEDNNDGWAIILVEYDRYSHRDPKVKWSMGFKRRHDSELTPFKQYLNQSFTENDYNTETDAKSEFYMTVDEYVKGRAEEKEGDKVIRHEVCPLSAAEASVLDRIDKSFKINKLVTAINRVRKHIEKHRNKAA